MPSCCGIDPCDGGLRAAGWGYRLCASLRRCSCLLPDRGSRPLARDARRPPPSPKPATPTVAAQKQTPERLTVAAIGDSLGDGLWEGLYRRLHSDKRIVVFRGARHSVGFTGSDMTEQIDAAFAAGPVDALVIMIGANDDRRSFFINGKSQALFGTKQVDRALSRPDREVHGPCRPQECAARVGAAAGDAHRGRQPRRLSSPTTSSRRRRRADPTSR